jgi:predicted secreted hydrolase
MTQLFKKVALMILVLFLMSTTAGHNGIGADQSDFLSVTGPCNLVFPKDHGLHSGYRTEWWYYTGNLEAETGNRYGFQLTFFRSQINTPADEKGWPRPPSAWRTRQIYLGHAAITDIFNKRHMQSELMARGILGMAGVSQEEMDTLIFIKNWSAKIEADRHLLKTATDDFSYQLALKPAKPPVLHGEAGYSRKGSTPERASCYYSFPRLKTEGALTVGEKTVAVQGLSWMDHEFSTAPLEPGIIGWDWFSLQLSNQTEVMLFLLRNEKGGFNPASSGTFIDASGKPHHLKKNRFQGRCPKFLGKSPFPSRVSGALATHRFSIGDSINRKGQPIGSGNADTSNHRRDLLGGQHFNKRFGRKTSGKRVGLR